MGPKISLKVICIQFKTVRFKLLRVRLDKFDECVGNEHKKWCPLKKFKQDEKTIGMA